MNNYKVEVEVIEETTTIIEELMTPTFIALAASVAAATVIVILLIALICHRLCRPNPGYVVAKVQDGEIDLTKLPENSNYHTTGATIHPKLELLEYPRNDIIYIRDIGQGAFGRVFQVGSFFRSELESDELLSIAGQSSETCGWGGVHDRGRQDAEGGRHR